MTRPTEKSAVGAQCTPGPSFLAGWDAISQKSDGNEYFQIIATIFGNKVGPVADTLNCHHCLSIEDQGKVAHLIAAAPDLHAALSKAYAVLCALPPKHRVHIQAELCACRDAITLARYSDAEEVQDEHEEIAFNDSRRLVFL